jgi:zinc protease
MDPGSFSITAQLMPGKEPAEVEREIDTLVDKIKSELISERDLQKAKNQVESSFIFAQDSIFGQAMKIGSYEANGGWRQMDQYIDGIRRVTREDIQRVAREYLDRDRRTVGMLIPTKDKT